MLRVICSHDGSGFRACDFFWRIPRGCLPGGLESGVRGFFQCLEMTANGSFQGLEFCAQA